MIKLTELIDDLSALKVGDIVVLKTQCSAKNRNMHTADINNYTVKITNIPINANYIEGRFINCDEFVKIKPQNINWNTTKQKNI